MEFLCNFHNYELWCLGSKQTSVLCDDAKVLKQIQVSVRRKKKHFLCFFGESPLLIGRGHCEDNGDILPSNASPHLSRPSGGGRRPVIGTAWARKGPTPSCSWHTRLPPPTWQLPPCLAPRQDEPNRGLTPQIPRGFRRILLQVIHPIFNSSVVQLFIHHYLLGYP